MNFGKLGNVETADEYLNIAFNQAKEHSAEIAKNLTGSPFQRMQRRELDAINVVHNVLIKHFMTILTSFPNIQELDPFYRELTACVVDVAQVRQSLGGVNWAVHRIREMFQEFNQKFRGSGNDSMLLKHKRAYYGRVSSVVKKLKTDFMFLNEARRAMKELPSFKTSIPTIVIAGLPNVGKSTLLKALTGSAPAIADYPFTTKSMMLGYMTHNDKKWQVIDTPGLLDRPIAKRNTIEKQAALALKHLATVVVFVIDPTEACGFPLAEQKNLLKEIAKTLEVPVVIALNKSDLATKEQLSDATERSQHLAQISANNEEGIKELITLIAKAIPPKVEQPKTQ